MNTRFAPLLALLSACATNGVRGIAAQPTAQPATGLETPVALTANQGVLLLLGTNDMHGSFDSFSWFSGYAAAARAHLDRQYPNQGKLLLLDAGDAAQGTLLSNFSEGSLAASLMNLAGYAAGVPGNHAYDFGPVGWTVDTCAPADSSCDPLGALKRFTASVHFPILGANVRTRGANPKNLPFLPASTTVDFMGRKIALIGLDNYATPSTTIAQNIAAIQFGKGDGRELVDEVERLWSSGGADVFVLLMHEGDADAQNAAMRKFLASLPKRSSGEPLVDAAIAGHTHTINDDTAAGIPYIQSGANGAFFGLIELVLEKDPATGRLHVLRDQTRKKAAIPILSQPTQFLGQPVVEDAAISSFVKKAQAQLAPIAGRKLAVAADPIPIDGQRRQDSVMGNLFAAMMKRAAGTELAIINSGDIRKSAALDDGFRPGPVLFEDLFDLVPKNLRLVTLHQLAASKLVVNLHASIESCDHRGALQISGARLVFNRSCPSTGATSDIDPNAELLQVVLDSGEVLYDHRDGKETYSRATVSLATTDFVMTGGSGYRGFIGLSADPGDQDLREEVAKQLQATGTLKAADYPVGRYVNCEEGPLTTDPLCHSP